MTTAQLTALKDELMAELRAEMEREKQNKTTYQKALEPMKKEISSFDYTAHYSVYNVNGKLCESSKDIRCDHVIRGSIAGLLRVVYKVDAVAKLPSEREKEIQRFVGAVLLLMKQSREEFEKGSGGK